MKGKIIGAALIVVAAVLAGAREVGLNENKGERRRAGVIGVKDGYARRREYSFQWTIVT
jgi:hypothetical protein